jgi:hypothetical protein
MMGTFSSEGDTFDGFGTWQGESSGTLLFTAVEQDLGPTPDQDRFHGFGSAAVPVTDGAIVHGVSIPLQPVGQRLVTGTVSVPEVYSAAGASAVRWIVFPHDEHSSCRTG